MCTHRVERQTGRFKQTEEEASGQQAAVVLDETLQQSDQAEEEHIGGQPDVGAQLLEENIGGDLEEDVGDEENDESSVVLRPSETKLLGQAKDVCVGDVDAVCWRVLAMRCPIGTALRDNGGAYRGKLGDT